MSTCERTTMETHTKEDLEVLADYIENSFDSMFPEIELALHMRVSPTTWINNSVYADQDTVESTGSAAGQKFREKWERSSSKNRNQQHGPLSV